MSDSFDPPFGGPYFLADDIITDKHLDINRAPVSKQKFDAENKKNFAGRLFIQRYSAATNWRPGAGNDISGARVLWRKQGKSGTLVAYRL